MDTMKKLYEKVAGDSVLQAKFAEIMNEGEEAGKAATEKKLIAFAKDAGFQVTLEEMQDYFNNLSRDEEGELSEVELDAVAGGKASPEIINSLLPGIRSCNNMSLMIASAAAKCGNDTQPPAYFY